MKKMKWLFNIVAIGFCILFFSTSILAADLSQPVWPTLSSAQYYWYEPQTDFTIEQADAMFKEVTTTEVSLAMSQYPNKVCIIKNAQSVIKNIYKGKKVNYGSLKFETIWEGYSEPYQIFVALNAIQKMELYYVSKAKNKWLLIMSTLDGSYDIYFKDEDSARKFGSALASILTRIGFSLKFSKLGLSTIDLTPAQAEALGKTRIDNVLVTLVAIDGPADKANIQPLDVITEVNGVKVKNDSHFNSFIEGFASGSKIILTCLRRTEVGDKGQKQFDWKPIVIEVTVK